MHKIVGKFVGKFVGKDPAMVHVMVLKFFTSLISGTMHRGGINGDIPTQDNDKPLGELAIFLR